MSDFVQLFESTGLYRELQVSTGRAGLSTADVTALSGTVVAAIRHVAPLLARIVLTFPQYTNHDIQHSRNVADLIGKLIPSVSLASLNGVEIALLILATQLHDVGMFVADEEVNRYKKSTEFSQFRTIRERHLAASDFARASGHESSSDLIETAFFSDFVRRLHSQRTGDHIRKHLSEICRFRDVSYVDLLAKLCESHAWPVFQIDDPTRCVASLDTQARIADVTINLQYLACLLRLGDILDFDRSRTPIAVFECLDLAEENSWLEWNKHLQISGWLVSPTAITFHAECTHPVFHLAVNQFLDQIEREMKDCCLLLSEAPRSVAEHYQLNLVPFIDRRRVLMKDAQYLAGEFRFTLEYEEILKLLMDRALYSEPGLFLRELLQNSLDACRRNVARAIERARELGNVSADQLYQPHIQVWDCSKSINSRRVVFQDNGVGMSRHDIESYLLRVGRSYYRSPEFDFERSRLAKLNIFLDACSQFGIGFLSCFLVADRIEIRTWRHRGEELTVNVDGVAGHFTIQRAKRHDRDEFPYPRASPKSSGPLEHLGTRVTVYLRDDVSFDVEETIRQFAANCEVVVDIIGEGSYAQIGPMAWEAGDTRASQFKEWMPSMAGYPLKGRPESDPRQDQIAAIWDPHLIAVEIPFQNIRGLERSRGRAWFYLLKGSDGQPTVAEGFLQVSRAIHPCGPYAFLREAMGILSPDAPPSRAELLKLFGTENSSRTALTKSYIRKIGVKDRRNRMIKLVRKWALLSAEEQAAVLSGLSLAPSSQNRFWYENLSLVDKLVRGDCKLIADDFGVSIADGNELFIKPRTMRGDPVCIGGILIPQGISDSSEWPHGYHFLGVPGVVLLDIRGQKVPRPSANRSFIPPESAFDVARSFACAALAKALTLAQGHEQDRAWRNWVAAVGFPLGFDHYPILATITAIALEPLFGFCVRHNGQRTFVDRQGLRDLFGSQVKFCFGRPAERGIDCEDEMSSGIVRTWPRLRDANGVQEFVIPEDDGMDASAMRVDG